MSEGRPTHFYLLRHGEVEGPPGLYGKTDVCLSDQGFKQMHWQAERLPNLDNILSSPLRRCKEFAKELTQERELELQVEAGIQECDFGEWDGIIFNDQSNHWPLMTSFWQEPNLHSPPQGESLQTFHDRVVNCWAGLCQNLSKQDNLLVCHGGVIRQILAHVLPADWRSGSWYSQLQIGYGSLSKITIPSYQSAQPAVNYIGLPPEHD